MPFCEFDEQCTKFAILAKHVNGVNERVSRYVFGAVVTMIISLLANFNDFRLLCSIVITNRN